MSKSTITQELVQSLLDYSNGCIYWKLPIGKKVIAGTKAGHLSKSLNRYKVTFNGKRYFVSRIIFIWHNGYLPKVVDHINRIKTDDRIDNLRAATKSQNSKNRTSSKNSTSQYLGVSYCLNVKKWRTSITVDGKDKHIGLFEIETDAAKAYNDAALLYNGEFASLNLIN